MLRDQPRVLADQHHHDARDYVAAAIAGRGALANHGSGNHASEVSDLDRRAIAARRDDDVFYVVRVGDQAFGANHILISPAFDIAAAGVGIILLDGVEDLAERKSIGHKLRRIELDRQGLELTAVGVDFDHARH